MRNTEYQTLSKNLCNCIKKTSKICSPVPGVQIVERERKLKLAKEREKTRGDFRSLYFSLALHYLNAWNRLKLCRLQNSIVFNDSPSTPLQALKLHMINRFSRAKTAILGGGGGGHKV